MKFFSPPTMIAIAVLFSSSVRAEQRIDWAGGVGMALCSDLALLDDQRLSDWVFGYWTGANLYLGGTDLCVERASIVGIPTSSVRALMEVHCAPIQDSPIMFAAFNSLKGLPKNIGSRAAACGGN